MNWWNEVAESRAPDSVIGDGKGEIGRGCGEHHA